jgi:hypothetical protein
VSDDNQKAMRPGLDICLATCKDKVCNYYYNNGLVPIFKQSWEQHYFNPCLNYDLIPICGIPIPETAFTAETTTDGKSGCVSTEKGNAWIFPEAANNDNRNDEDRVKGYCYYNSNCKGYYATDAGDWSKFIATDTDPKDCTEKDGTGYTKFIRKNSGPY